MPAIKIAGLHRRSGTTCPRSRSRDYIVARALQRGEPLSEFDQPVDLFETATSMGALRLIIAQLRVGREFFEFAAARPIFCGAHEGAPNSLTARGVFDIPALDMRHRHRIAAIGECADRKLDEANGPPVTVFGEK